MFLAFVLLACALVLVAVHVALSGASRRAVAGFLALGLAGGAVVRGYAALVQGGLSYDLHFYGFARAGLGALLVVGLCCLALFRREAQRFRRPESHRLRAKVSRSSLHSRATLGRAQSSR